MKLRIKQHCPHPSEAIELSAIVRLLLRDIFVPYLDVVRLIIMPSHKKAEKNKTVMCNPCPCENWTFIRRVQSTASREERKSASMGRATPRNLSNHPRSINQLSMCFFLAKYPKCTHSMYASRWRKVSSTTPEIRRPNLRNLISFTPATAGNPSQLAFSLFHYAATFFLGSRERQKNKKKILRRSESKGTEWLTTREEKKTSRECPKNTQFSSSRE